MADKNFVVDFANATCSSNGMNYLQNTDGVSIYNPVNQTYRAVVAARIDFLITGVSLAFKTSNN